MQELIEGCVAIRLLDSGNEFIARGRSEERARNWNGAACCYVNAARQLGWLPGQTERRAKALGRAGLCFSRDEDLELAMACYEDAWLLCREIGEIVAAECLSRKMAIINGKQLERMANHAYMRDVQKEAKGQAVVVLQQSPQTRTVGCGCEDGELRAVDGKESRLDADAGRKEDVLGDAIPLAAPVQISGIRQSNAAALCAPLPES